MRGRSVIVVATVFAAIGAAMIGGWWSASDEGGGARRPATTMTPHRAARVAASVMRTFEANRRLMPVLHCKLATPRQRYWCGSARPLTAANVAAQILACREAHTEADVSSRARRATSGRLKRGPATAAFSLV